MAKKELEEIYKEISLEYPNWADSPDGGLETAYNMGFNDALQAQRYCFVKDEDAHDYLIPFDMKEEFNELLFGEDLDAFIDKFDNMRLNTPYVFYSFTDPRKE